MKSSVTLPYYTHWPKIESAIGKDDTIEQEISYILSLMTIEEKVGQMIQPNLRDISPEELRQYKLGSILNGGGSWPNENKYASAKEWAEKADEFWLATEEVFKDRPFRIPFIWATDAVHGHNNVYGATVFPHNIGLGATRDNDLIERIGAATAVEVCATGLDWTFAPTVATPRNLRWGRVYEGYSEDPEITYQYAEAMVRGLQGDEELLKGDTKVISNVKHWLGDGGTADGVDRGINNYSEELLINIHGMGYFSGLNAGAQVVMSSFNSWTNEANYDHNPDTTPLYNHKLHGSHYLLNDVLKQQMGFDGLVVTDWNGHSEVSKCSEIDATYAINAGNDILMVPVREHWPQVYKQTIKDIQSGQIKMSRIDDAVKRILRVKMRAGLWQKSKPSERQLAGKPSALNNPHHRALAREAVRKSLVLLKNNQQTLPLKPSQRILLTGSAANDIQKQTGGWNLTWQGTENTLEDFPNATTIKSALESVIDKNNLLFSPQLDDDLSNIDVAIVAFGEDPYSEMMGDIKQWQSLEFASLKRSYRKDVDKIRYLQQQGIKVISLFFSGRPLYVNEEIAMSDAFIAAFLPGTEAQGITDVIIGDDNGKPIYDFSGKLSYSWPNKKLSSSVNRIPPHIPNYQLPESEQDPLGKDMPLFPYGYGLNYANHEEANNLNMIELDISEESQNQKNIIELFGVRSIIGDYQAKIHHSKHNDAIDVSLNNPLYYDWITTLPYNYQLQQDAVEVKFTDHSACFYIQTADGEYDNVSAFTTLSFELLISTPVQQPIYIAMGESRDIISCDIDKQFNIQPKLKSVVNEWQTITVNIDDLLPSDHQKSVDVPFAIWSSTPLSTVIANVRLY